MAICTTCGAASAMGTAHCAACGAAFAAAAPDTGPAIGEVEFEGGRQEPGPPGRWGGGREVAPRRWDDALELVTGPGWLPVLRVVAATTGLLLLFGLLAAVALAGLDDPAVGTGFGVTGPSDRYGVGLAAALTAFGGSLSSIGSSGPSETALVVRLVPLTGTVLWALLFAFGLRRWAGPTVRQAVRAGLLAVPASGLLALASGLDRTASGTDGLAPAGLRTVVTPGLLGPMAGTAVLAALVGGWVCWGAPALRERAPLWSAAVPAAARGAASAVGLSSVVALVVLATQVPLRTASAGLLVLPNLGLALLAFGGGAGLRSAFSSPYVDEAGRQGEDRAVSLFDLEGLSDLWLLTPLVALAAVLLLARSARALARPVRLRAAGLLWAGLALLTAVAGLRYETVYRMVPAVGESAESVVLSTTGFDLPPLLVVHLVLVGLGVVAVPELLDRLGGRDRPAAPAPPAGPGPAEDDPTGLELTASGYLPPQGGEVLDFGKR
ncbi:hypothetical protein ACIA8O_27925 [Kitasatospora sp. NPDC051853]|uniref:hypothetical protein n=1 Tax=Kitasatospora sp. NPDC051853 TaxID=3364058 RepID=UPI0037BAF855